MEKVATKLLILLMMLSASLAFTACGDDDDEPSQNFSQQIVGRWIVEQASGEGNEFEIGEILYFSSSKIFTWSWEEDGETESVGGDYSIVNGPRGPHLTINLLLNETTAYTKGDASIEGNIMTYRFDYHNHGLMYGSNLTLILRKVE